MIRHAIRSRCARPFRVALGAVLLLASGLAGAAMQINMDPGVSPISRTVYSLHNTIMWIILVIFVGVFGVMFYSIFKFRRSRGARAAQFHENTTVEVVWTVIPFLILLLMAYPATRTLLDMRDTSTPDMTVKVTGSQWKWTYDYIESGFSYTSNLATPLAQIYGQEPKGEHYLLEVDQPLVVPAGKKVRVLITAVDVLHAWWVPSLGVKQDAVPGFVRDAWFTAEKVGIYRGQCAELCGKDHGFMPVVVEVKSAEDFARWAAERKKAATAAAAAPVAPAAHLKLADLVARGEHVYLQNCAACHQPNGRGALPAFPPLDGSKIATGSREEQLKVVLQGRPGTAMSAFRHLSDADLAAVATFTRNAWSNRTGEAIQPAEVSAARARMPGEPPAGVASAPPVSPGAAPQPSPAAAAAPAAAPGTRAAARGPAAA